MDTVVHWPRRRGPVVVVMEIDGDRLQVRSIKALIAAVEARGYPTERTGTHSFRILPKGPRITSFTTRATARRQA